MKKLPTKYKERAQQLDDEDPLKEFKKHFEQPTTIGNKPLLYFCNNSLGLPAKASFSMMEECMKEWSQLGIEGWFKGDLPWYTAMDRPLREPLMQLLGTEYDEVIVMNSLTVNLHLLLVSFYRPTKMRYKILTDAPSFPSDLYALKSHLHLHGFDPNDALITIGPKAGCNLIDQETILKAISQQGDEIALVHLNNVNFLTGQLLDIAPIAQLAHSKGCVIGCDIAHAAGNIPLKLHDWNIDFAVGCSYKYLCSGPGGPGIAFVHQRHHNTVLPRFSGWWGNDPSERFKMQLEEEFIPFGGAYSWQVSTPSVLSMIPLIASLKIYQEAGIERMRAKSKLQSAFILELLDELNLKGIELITPRNPEKRGAQLSLLVKDQPMKLLERLERERIICDFRQPNVIRVTPSPLYNSFEEIYELASRLSTN